MRIVVISNNQDASPKVLRSSIKTMLEKEKVDVVEISDDSFLARLFPLLGNDRKPGALHFRLRRMLENWRSDRAKLRQLRGANAVIFCTQTPNGFWRHEYGIEKLKRQTGLPVIYYEVYYLGNAPSQIRKLQQGGHFSVERYDWHLAVSQHTEIFSQESPPWSVVGLNLEASGLNVPARKKRQALIDFKQVGYEHYRNDVLEALSNSAFSILELEDRMPLHEIRQLYRESAMFFLSSPEAFGVPIAECLSCGTAVFTPTAEWPMAWNIADSGKDECPKLPEECFWVYSDRAHLTEALERCSQLPDSYPNRVRGAFERYYPQFIRGKQSAVQALLERIATSTFD